jgi:hypothetical protein
MSVNQSYVSDELTHFVGRAMPDHERYALLLKVLGPRSDSRTPREGWLRASYREQFGLGFVMSSDERKPISTNETIRCTMLCFCDIPPGQLEIHMAKYGSSALHSRNAFSFATVLLPFTTYQATRVTRPSESARGTLHPGSTICTPSCRPFETISKGTSPALMDTRPVCRGSPRQVRRRATDFADASRGCRVSSTSSFSGGLSFFGKEFRRIGSPVERSA